jgi:hypothetical protein
LHQGYDTCLHYRNCCHPRCRCCRCCPILAPKTMHDSFKPLAPGPADPCAEPNCKQQQPILISHKTAPVYAAASGLFTVVASPALLLPFGPASCTLPGPCPRVLVTPFVATHMVLVL